MNQPNTSLNKIYTGYNTYIQYIYHRFKLTTQQLKKTYIHVGPNPSEGS